MTPVIPERPCLLHSHFAGGGFGAPIIDVRPRVPLTQEQIKMVDQSPEGRVLYIVHADDAAGPADFHPETLDLALSAGYFILWQPCTLPDPKYLALAIETEGDSQATILAIRADQALCWAQRMMSRPPRAPVRLLFPNPVPAAGHGNEGILLQ